MSQDIFEDLEELSEVDDYDDPGSPIEFSGVSTRSSAKSSPNLSKPARQTRQTRQKVAASSSSPSSPAQPFCMECPNCRPKKKYTTQRGWDAHIRDKHQGVVPIAPTTSASSSQVVVGSERSDASGFVCQICQAKLKKRATLVAHVARHQLDDICKRKPPPADFKKKEVEVIQKIVREMREEPKYGSQSEVKDKFLEEFSITAEGSEFLSVLSGTICSWICGKSKKIFPLMQYEEAQQELNKFLNNDVNMATLKLKLTSLCSQEIPSEMAARLVTRISLKLMNEIQCWVASEMRGTLPHQPEPPEPAESQPATEMEEEAFNVFVGNILRAFYKKGIRSRSRMWQSQSDCIISTFVIGPHPIRTSHFMTKSNWFSGDEGAVIPSENIMNFSKNVEQIIKLTLESNGGKFPSAQEVTEKIVLSADSLNYWYNLTNAYLSEEETLLFMREFIYTFVNSSRKEEESRRNRQEDRSVRESTTALRTHLQRNLYSGQDSTSENIV